MLAPFTCFSFFYNQWWTTKDLNLEPSGYEPDALPIELMVHVEQATENNLVLSIRRTDVLLSYRACIGAADGT